MSYTRKWKIMLSVLAIILAIVVILPLNPLRAQAKEIGLQDLNYLNSMISFLNTLVYTTVLSQIYQTHLDPRIGFLHTSNFRKFSLNLDIAEIFKPLLVDRLIFSLTNKGEINKNSFDKKVGGIVFTEKAVKKVIERYDERLRSTISHKDLKRDVTYKSLILMECYKVEKHLIGEKEYQPFVMYW